MFIAVFTIAGISALFMSGAATPRADKEAESGALSGNAKKVTDANRSGGQYVQFNAKTCTSFTGPITITTGGTYTGCWQTTDGATPAIRINTKEPVTIANSTIKGNYMLINDAAPGVNLTVTNTHFIGVEPTSPVTSRRAIRLGRGASNLAASNNFFENTAGIKITGWTTNASANPNTIKILQNKAKNITNKNIAEGDASSDDHLVQFVQLGQMRLSNVEIAWNEVINTFGRSRVEDNINLYKTGGTGNAVSSRIRVHNNFIWGAFPETVGNNYRGGGIIAGDSSQNLDVGWVDIYDNQVVGTINYGVSIVCGHDSRAYRNRVIGSGLNGPNGQLMAAANVGLSGNNARAWLGRCDPDNYRNNVFQDNYVGWMNGNGKRNDMTFRCNDYNAANPPELILCANNINTTQVHPTSAAITYAMEQAEYTSWQKKLSDNNVSIGLKQ